MGCLNLKKYKHESRIIKMPKKKKNVIQEENSNNVNNKKISAKAIIEIIGAIFTIVSLLAILFEAYNYVESKFDKLNDKLNECLKKDEISNLTTDVSEMREYLYSDDGVKDQLGEFSDKMDKVTNLLNITAIKADVTTEEYIRSNVSIVDNDISNSTSSISSDTCIGTDSEGNVYIAKNLVDKTILLTYTEDDKEIYFLGQYNKNYHWNGYCVINTYDADGKLNSINESNFDDGNRLDYESFYLSDKQNEWIYTDRDCKKETNEGISIRYKSNFSKQKNFTATNVRVSDLIYIESMKEYDNKEILSYYMGKTSNGVYNDDSGNAYLVRYNSEGFVSVYYKGNFKDGDFEDENAIEIVLDESDNINKYFLYNGGFTRGERISDDGIKYITQDEINTILKENGCKDNFTWYSENS